MKTKWDYTTLAEAYLKRPAYSGVAIDELIAFTGVSDKDIICDVGAGAAHLTIELAQRGHCVIAVEPNDAMRKNGIRRTREMKNVEWYEGTGEDTQQSENRFSLVTFGSSFNVTDRLKALKETFRILKPAGFFACMWNHRDLEDAIQKEIENIIRHHIPEYGYGSRREDQTEIIKNSKLFGSIVKIEGDVIHKQTKEDCIEAWYSHATLKRQAGSKFNNIMADIQKMLHSIKTDPINIPYTTNIWVAKAVAK